MIVKICGITNREDALAALDGGADALGFNFWSRSPRNVSPETAAGIAALAPAGVRRVGVFVNEAPERVAEIARLVGLDVAQLHGDEDVEDYPPGIPVWKAVRVGEGFELAGWRNCPAEAILLDGPAEQLYGGAGRTFDWRLAAVDALRIVIAGGLDASSVARAVALARPWGVDACSRIESAPGKKDHVKMREFLKAARGAQ